MRGPRKVLPRAGGRAEHRRGKRVGKRAGVPIRDERQRANTRERRGSCSEERIDRTIEGNSREIQLPSKR